MKYIRRDNDFIDFNSKCVDLNLVDYKNEGKNSNGKARDIFDTELEGIDENHDEHMSPSCLHHIK